MDLAGSKAVIIIGIGGALHRVQAPFVEIIYNLPPQGTFVNRNMGGPGARGGGGSRPGGLRVEGPLNSLS